MIGQFEYQKYLMMGGGGGIEVDWPSTDDERRDAEIHIRGKYGVSLASQVKTTMQLHRMSKGVDYLYILFDVRPERLVNSPFYYYFLAYLDPKLMRLADPTFLVPSEDFHRLAAPRLRNGVWQFTMAASMKPESRDKWHPYRVNRLNLGQRMLDVIASLTKLKSVGTMPIALLAIPDIALIHSGRR